MIYVSLFGKSLFVALGEGVAAFHLILRKGLPSSAVVIVDIFLGEIVGPYQFGHHISLDKMYCYWCHLLTVSIKLVVPALRFVSALGFLPDLKLVHTLRYVPA